MKKDARFEVKFDAAGDLRWYLFAGNGRELCRSTDSLFKRMNGERSAQRVKDALQNLSDDDVLHAILEFRRVALKAEITRGPGRGRRVAA